MKSDSSEKSESCCDDSDDDSTENVPIISSTSNISNEPDPYEHIEENIYLIDKKKHINKEVRRMTCECELDDDKDDVPCGENCLNRLLLIECNHKCPCGDSCTNKRFQQGCKVKIEVFKTDKKGWGVKTLEDLEANQFVMEYCGEVMNYRDFQNRAEQYDRQKRRHYYFMTLRADEIIDATFKGSLSRFVNHSCDPNCVTEKWTVNGLLRIGFFTLCKIQAGEELTFDYQLQRYGKVAQTCYCESPNCRGIIGGEKHTPLKHAIGKIVTTPISSPRRIKKKIGRTLEADFDDMSIEEELERLIGDHRGLTHSDQALKLSRLMVRAETTPQRTKLLKVLQNTTDQNCLKAFLRFQGLLLLWSWMVDAGSKPTGKLQLELLATLKYLPVTNKNQLEDSRVIKVVKKWAYKEITDQEMPSSCSSQEDNPEDIDRTLTQEELDISLSERTKKRLDYIGQLSSPGSSVKGGDDEGTKADKSPEDLSEDDTKSTEDEQSLLSEEDGDVQVAPLAYELLKQWSTLKEVYRIPKKSTKKPEVVVATSSTETPASEVVEQEQSVLVSLPDSSGNFDDSHKPPDAVRSTPPPLMSLDVPMKSKGDSSSVDGSQREESEQDQAQIGWKSISSTSIDPSSSQEKVQELSPEGSDSRHQVFGYKQRMGNGMGADQGFGGGQQFHSNWSSSGKSKKFGKKSKWKQNTQLPPSQVGSAQGLPSSSMNTIGYTSPANFNNSQRQSWQGSSQQWQKGPQDANPGSSFYGMSDPIAYQGQYGQPDVPPSNMAPCSIPPPNMPMPPNFPRNIPPPNFPPPHPVGYPPGFPRLPPNVPLPTTLPPDVSPLSRLANPPQAGLPPQFVTNYPPAHVPFQSFNSPGPPQVQYNIAPSSKEVLGKDSPSPSELESNVNSGIRPSQARESSLSPVRTKKPTTNLPPNWKTASDPQGKIYYYHTVTRKTQWEVPKDEGHDMDIETPSDEEPLFKKKKPRTPKTPPGTPPRSPALTFTTAAADTTQNRRVPSPSPDLSSLDPNAQKQKIKDTFRMKLSNVVVNCLNPYHKVDCKQGRITNSTDFKYLARRLTHGIMNKELQHVKSEEMLQCNDSVKVKTKEYIRSYMKKFDTEYKRS